MDAIAMDHGLRLDEDVLVVCREVNEAMRALVLKLQDRGLSLDHAIDHVRGEAGKLDMLRLIAQHDPRYRKNLEMFVATGSWNDA